MSQRDLAQLLIQANLARKALMPLIDHRLSKERKKTPELRELFVEGYRIRIDREENGRIVHVAIGATDAQGNSRWVVFDNKANDKNNAYWAFGSDAHQAVIHEDVTETLLIIAFMNHIAMFLAQWPDDQSRFKGFRDRAYQTLRPEREHLAAQN